MTDSWRNTLSVLAFVIVAVIGAFVLPAGLFFLLLIVLLLAAIFVRLGRRRRLR